MTGALDVLVAAVVDDVLVRVRTIVREEVQAALRETGQRLQEPAVASPEFLTIPQVANLLGVTEPTVRGWVQRGELHATRIGVKGRRYVVKRGDLDAYIEGQPVTRQRNRDAVDKQATEIVSLARARAAKASRRGKDG